MLLLCLLLPAGVAAQTDWFTITAEKDGVNIKLDRTGTPADVSLRYSTDGGVSWQAVPGDKSVFCTLAQTGDRLHIRGNNPNGINNEIDYGNRFWYFVISGEVSLSGNIMTLVDDDHPSTVIPSQYCFFRMFQSCPLTDISGLSLPATTLKKGCYEGLFQHCRKMTAPPVLGAPAIVPEAAMKQMFMDCESLASAPALPADSVAGSGYEQMFHHCPALVSAPALPATHIGSSCYHTMFARCTSLTEAPELPAKKAPSHCYNSMFSGCSELVSAPSELPALRLSAGCYASMFADCPKLTAGPVIRARELYYKKDTQGCMAYMFYKCSSLASVTVHFKLWNEEGNRSTTAGNSTNPTASWMYGTPQKSASVFYCPCPLADVRNEHHIRQYWTRICIPEYTFRLSNGGTWSNGMANDSTLTQPFSAPVCTREGYVFAGWNTEADGSGTAFDIDNLPSGEDVTFEALWQPEDLVLYDNIDNTALLEGYMGLTVSSVRFAGRTISAASTNTLCLPFSLTAEQIASSPLAGARIWQFNSAVRSEDLMDVNMDLTDGIEAGYPYLVQPATDLTEPVFTGVRITSTDEQTRGDGNVTFIAAQKPYMFTAGDESQLFLGAGNTLHAAAVSKPMRAYRAWFKITGSASVGIRRARLVFGKEKQVPTDIQSADSRTQQPQFVMINGTPAILRNGIYYDLCGSPVAAEGK
ncbi:MAG: InlB B-repeat-containing protein [Paludibacteraceae bacterium]|nr:InlB B-repeat-containing protein [Paludibacteraceae bacterium]